MRVRPAHWITRLARATALAGLMLAAVPVALRAVPGLRAGPRVTVGLGDHGTDVEQRVLRQGFDTYGYVRQERARSWEAPTAALLDPVRRARPTADLPPAQSWRLQLTSYGNNHVFLPGGVSLLEAGVLFTVPYSLAAIALASPAAAWGMLAGWQRLRQRS